MPAVLAGCRAHASAALRGSLVDLPWWTGPRLVLVFAPIMGLACGSFSVNAPGRAPLMLYAALKMPFLILMTAALCLPPFFAMHAALGVRRDFPISLRAVMGAQGVAALALAALAPLIPILYTATDSKDIATLMCAACFAAAAAASLLIPFRVYRAADRDTPVHRWLLLIWLVLYAFVGTQLGWILRPFVGSPGTTVAPFRTDALTNGYVEVTQMLFGG